MFIALELGEGLFTLWAWIRFSTTEDFIPKLIFSGIDSLSGYIISLPDNDLSSHSNHLYLFDDCLDILSAIDDNDLDFLVKFNLYNKKTFVGPIIATVKKVGQDLIVVDYNNKNILIPFAKDLVSDIDKKKQILIMNLPTGLLEI